MDRRYSILRAIVRHFIDTANPVGSKAVQETKDFNISAATIRNEMAILEKEGFLEHPHTSAGRIPTAQGYRLYVNDIQLSEKEKKKVEEDFSSARDQHYREKMADQRVFDAVAILTKITPNIAFASVPSAKRTFFLGLSNILREPEFTRNTDMASQIVKVLEDDFANILEDMEITEEISLFIGPENLIPDFDACSLIAFEFDVLRTKGTIGILGPMRMPYKRNILALEATRAFLAEKLLR
jgi:transcriptional regulator of heat shock response